MDTLTAIHTRRSIRQYRKDPVPDDILEQVLRAAMAAPSARNGQPWHLVVIRDPDLLSQVPSFHPNGAMAAEAPLAILVCGDIRLEGSPGYWSIDCAAATQNLLLAAHDLGLGAVWTGVYPREERIAGFRQLLDLPEEVIPHTLVPLGYPAETPISTDRYAPQRVHYDGWKDTASSGAVPWDTSSVGKRRI
jgi:nitroreductase